VYRYISNIFGSYYEGFVAGSQCQRYLSCFQPQCGQFPFSASTASWQSPLLGKIFTLSDTNSCFLAAIAAFHNFANCTCSSFIRSKDLTFGILSTHLSSQLANLIVHSAVIIFYHFIMVFLPGKFSLYSNMLSTYSLV
jgi:hypothetical protein